CERHAMLLHESFEKTSGPFLVVNDFLLQCRYRQRTYVAQGEGSGHRNSQAEPFDVAVEFLCEKQSGAQGRVHEIMLFDRDKNGLETHGDLQSRRSPPGVRASMGEACRHLRTINERTIGTFVANLPKPTLPEKAEILAAAFKHGRVRLKPTFSGHSLSSRLLPHFLTAAPGLPSSDSSSSTLSKSLASRKLR